MIIIMYEFNFKSEHIKAHISLDISPLNRQIVYICFWIWLKCLILLNNSVSQNGEFIENV